VFTLASLGPNFGPIYVEGAEPGDVIRIDVLEVTPGPYGWSAVVPGYGLLGNEFSDPVLKIYDLIDTNKDYTVFKNGIHVPVRPFLGTITVAAPYDDPVDPIPPYFWGGNMDTKALTAGSTLYLPVQKAGALVSGGDGHSAQGDGEMTGTGIETPMSGRLRLTVEKKMPWVQTPHYLNPKTAPQSRERGQEYAVLGVDEDLYTASQKALSGIIDWLEATRNLTRTEAYILSSAIADLKITEIVDLPIYAVACTIPLNVFIVD
jgi:acetamidase/formamidase